LTAADFVVPGARDEADERVSDARPVGVHPAGRPRQIPPSNLLRFVNAQQPGVLQRVVSELRQGQKTSHWMWFIFPQLKGLGTSSGSERFGIADAAEARAYLRHPALGKRLREHCHMLLTIQGKSARDILGKDHVKLQSSMTLFAEVADDDDKSLFLSVLSRFHGGRADQMTQAFLLSQVIKEDDKKGGPRS
jgi:uncharacterized protein (DUF1810 family)